MNCDTQTVFRFKPQSNNTYFDVHQSLLNFTKYRIFESVQLVSTHVPGLAPSEAPGPVEGRVPHE